jgi:hypothetical protein
VILPLVLSSCKRPSTSPAPRARPPVPAGKTITWKQSRVRARTDISQCSLGHRCRLPVGHQQRQLVQELPVQLSFGCCFIRQRWKHRNHCCLQEDPHRPGQRRCDQGQGSPHGQRVSTVTNGVDSVRSSNVKLQRLEHHHSEHQDHRAEPPLRLGR